MEIYLQIISGLEPLFLAATSLGIAVLALSVFRSNKNSATNIIYVLLSISILFWLWAAFMASLTQSESIALLFHRFAIFFAAPMSALFLIFSHTIPNSKILLKKKSFFAIVVLTIVMMVLNMSPYAFIGTSGAGSRNPIPGVGLIPFSVISSIFSLLAVYFLFRKYTRSEKNIQTQFRIILTGIFLMLLLVISTILIPIVFFQSGAFLPFLSLYTLVFLGVTAYAITKYQLFNIKIILTQSITVVIWITLFSKVFTAGPLTEKAVDALIFLITVLFGISLIRSVRNEIQQKERIQNLATELGNINNQQENLIHFISHEIKGYLTNAQAAFASISQGDFGEVNKDTKMLVDSALESTRKGSETVKEILSAANFKKGTITYKNELFDLNNATETVWAKLKPVATAKGLDFILNRSNKKFLIKGDEEQIKEHVIRNLIDNAIKYTLSGKITVNIEERDQNYLLSVQDTGVGITSEDMSRLFTEGGHGKNSLKINVHSTGYGLFIAKNIVNVHHGKIWAESDGSNKGSVFFVELVKAE